MTKDVIREGELQGDMIDDEKAKEMGQIDEVLADSSDDEIMDAESEVLDDGESGAEASSDEQVVDEQVVDEEFEGEDLDGDEDHEDGTVEAVNEEPSDAEIIAQLQEELTATAAEKDAAVDKMQRTAAEFQNARKRQELQLSAAIGRANKDLISRLLPVLDDFELAFQNVPELLDSDESDDEQSSEAAWIGGFEQIQKKLVSLLVEQGVTPIDVSGEFDPMLHEAILSEPSDEVESGYIIGVLRTGYEYKGQVLRASMVRVAS